MRTVWKFGIDPLNTDATIPMPEYATILHVAENPRPDSGQRIKGWAVWAEVDTEANKYEMRNFIIRGTGHSITWKGKEVNDDQIQFLGTMIVDTFVFHMWEYDEEGFTQPWETSTSQ